MEPPKAGTYRRCCHAFVRIVISARRDVLPKSTIARSQHRARRVSVGSVPGNPQLALLVLSSTTLLALTRMHFGQTTTIWKMAQRKFWTTGTPSSANDTMLLGNLKPAPALPTCNFWHAKELRVTNFLSRHINTKLYRVYTLPKLHQITNGSTRNSKRSRFALQATINRYTHNPMPISTGTDK